MLGNRATRLGAIRLLRRAEGQVLEPDEGPKFLRTFRGGTGVYAFALAKHAYDAANNDLGNGWRHRYCRAAEWIKRTYLQRALELPAPTAKQLYNFRARQREAACR